MLDPDHLGPAQFPRHKPMATSDVKERRGFPLPSGDVLPFGEIFMAWVDALVKSAAT